MKAWKCFNKYINAYIIVFAETRNRAKTLAMKSLWFEDLEYVEIKAVREKKADDYVDYETVFDGRNSAVLEEKLMYNLDML